MNYEDNPKSIKFYVKRYFVRRADEFKGKTVIDFPAGSGVTSRILKEIGSKPVPFDLFPEYFKIKDLTCTRANIADGIPYESDAADALVCQEGIEHFSDQLRALKEFNRVLKPKGTLLITTPNYSNLRSKLSYLLSESERFNSTMPPNELDSIWMSEQKIADEVYYGHIFLIGIQKLRVLAKLAGFGIKHIHFTRSKPTSLLLLPFFYPWILFFNWIAYKKNLRKKSRFSEATKREIYREIFRLSINPKLLVSSHLMVEFEKHMQVHEVHAKLKGIHKDFNADT